MLGRTEVQPLRLGISQPALKRNALSRIKGIHWVLSNAPYAQHTDPITVSEYLRAAVQTVRLQVAQNFLGSVTISLNIMPILNGVYPFEA